MKIDPSAYNDIIEAYTINLYSLKEIADILHVSRPAVHKFLNKHGVDTSKHKIQISCTTCGAVVERTRKRVRKQRNHFCSEDCYYAFLSAGKTSYIQSKNGQRLARTKVAQYFNLQPEHIVHHEDRNSCNNLLNNLKVFANQGDHIKYHHQHRDEYHNKLETEKDRKRHDIYYHYNGVPVTPIWQGSQAPNKYT